jgi:hypothetical protein
MKGGKKERGPDQGWAALTSDVKCVLSWRNLGVFRVMNWKKSPISTRRHGKPVFAGKMVAVCV